MCHLHSGLGRGLNSWPRQASVNYSVPFPNPRAGDKIFELNLLTITVILSYQRRHIWKCMVCTLSNFRAYKVIYGRKFRPYNCYTAGTLNRLICSSERQALPVFSWSQKGGGSASETSGLVMNKYLCHMYKYVPRGGAWCLFPDLSYFHGPPLPSSVTWKSCRNLGFVSKLGSPPRPWNVWESFSPSSRREITRQHTKFIWGMSGGTEKWSDSESSEISKLHFFDIQIFEFWPDPYFPYLTWSLFSAAQPSPHPTTPSWHKFSGLNLRLY